MKGISPFSGRKMIKNKIYHITPQHITLKNKHQNHGVKWWMPKQGASTKFRTESRGLFLTNRSLNWLMPKFPSRAFFGILGVEEAFISSSKTPGSSLSECQCICTPIPINSVTLNFQRNGNWLIKSKDQGAWQHLLQGSMFQKWSKATMS